MNSYNKHRVKYRFGQGGELNQDSAQTNPLGTYGGKVGGKERMESIHTTSGIPLVWTSLSLEHTSLGNCKQNESLQATTTLDYTWQGNPKTNPDIEMQEYLQSFFFQQIFTNRLPRTRHRKPLVKDKIPKCSALAHLLFLSNPSPFSPCGPKHSLT